MPGGVLAIAPEALAAAPVGRSAPRRASLIGDAHQRCIVPLLLGRRAAADWLHSSAQHSVIVGKPLRCPQIDPQALLDELQELADLIMMVWPAMPAPYAGLAERMIAVEEGRSDELANLMNL
jgi:hypothetical protein